MRLIDDLLQITVIEHLQRDVTTADKLTIDVNLRESRPVCIARQVLEYLRISQYVAIGELFTDLFQGFDCTAGEASLRELRCTLHIDHYRVAFNLLINPV